MLKKGSPYSSVTPEKCLSPREAAILKYRESKNVAEAKALELEEGLKQSELADWLKSMPSDDLLNQFYDKDRLQKIGDDKLKKMLAIKAAEENAKEYFALEIWPSKRQSIIAGISV